MIEHFFYWLKNRCGYRRVHCFYPSGLGTRDWVEWRYRPDWKEGSYTCIRGNIKFEHYGVEPLKEQADGR